MAPLRFPQQISADLGTAGGLQPERPHARRKMLSVKTGSAIAKRASVGRFEPHPSVGRCANAAPLQASYAICQVSNETRTGLAQALRSAVLPAIGAMYS